MQEVSKFITDAPYEGFSRGLALQLKGMDKAAKYYKQRVMMLHVCHGKAYLIFQPYDLNPNNEGQIEERKAQPKYFVVEIKSISDLALTDLIRDLFSLPWSGIDLTHATFEVLPLWIQD